MYEAWNEGESLLQRYIVRTHLISSFSRTSRLLRLVSQRAPRFAGRFGPRLAPMTYEGEPDALETSIHPPHKSTPAAPTLTQIPPLNHTTVGALFKE